MGGSRVRSRIFFSRWGSKVNNLRGPNHLRVGLTLA